MEEEVSDKIDNKNEKIYKEKQAECIYDSFPDEMIECLYDRNIKKRKI